MNDMTPREILDAIDWALEETARRLAARPLAAPLAPHDPPTKRMEEMTGREVLDAIDWALRETARQFAQPSPGNEGLESAGEKAARNSQVDVQTSKREDPSA